MEGGRKKGRAARLISAFVFRVQLVIKEYPVWLVRKE